ncbi:MAG: carbohydrate porin [Chlamydiales bacterium]|nr:carbohydrate porin [Chlamydiales bacterium]
MLLTLLWLIFCFTTAAFSADSNYSSTSYDRYLDAQDYYDESQNKMNQGFWERKYFTGDWGGARESLVDSGVTITSSFVSDVLGNPIGGKTQGFEQASSWGADLTLDMDRIASIKGMLLYTSISWRFGNNLSADMIGNQFNVAEVYGGENFRLCDLYVQQSIFNDAITIRLGRLSEGDTFLQSPIYSHFVSNAIDGNPVGILFNTQSPPDGGSTVTTAYPFTTWGAYLRIQPFSWFEMKFGVYNANTIIRENKYHGCNFTFDNTNGVEYITEWKVLINQGAANSGLPGNYKVGYYYVSGVWDKFLGGEQRGNYGYYFLFDQMVYHPDGSLSTTGLTPFIALLFAPEDIALFPVFFTAGATYRGLIPSREEDSVSLAFMYGSYSDDLRSAEQQAKNLGIPGRFGNIPQNFEMVIEATYWLQLNKWFYITPDVQYIINPRGLGNIPNALVLGTQIGITF